MASLCVQVGGVVLDVPKDNEVVVPAKEIEIQQPVNQEEEELGAGGKGVG